MEDSCRRLYRRYNPDGKYQGTINPPIDILTFSRGVANRVQSYMIFCYSHDAPLKYSSISHDDSDT